MKTGLLLLIAAATALRAGGAAAQRSDPARRLPELVEELFVAETVYPQREGRIQLTAQERVRHGADARYLAEYGLTGRLQIALTASAAGWEGEDEWAFEPELLYALLPYRSPLAVSVALGAEIGEGQRPRWEPTVIAARQFGRVQLHGSLAAELASGESSLSESAAILVDAGMFAPTLEGVWSDDEEPLLVPGFFVHLGRGFEAGAGQVLCASCAAPERGTHLMFTYEF
jgi:hypothetical protein